MRNFSLFDNKSRNQFWISRFKKSDIAVFQALSQVKMGLEIPNEYGYVILTGTASIFMLAYKVTWTSESKIGFENRDPGFELKTETGFQNWWKPVFKEPKIA